MIKFEWRSVMNRSRRLLLSALCLLALLANGAGALAQRQTQDKAPPPEGDARPRTNVMITSGPPDGDMQFNIMSEGPGDMLGLRVIESGLNFESAPVKGAPYSAEAVNESVQPLADGNRIVRKSTSLVYRDSEGRTRREQTLNNVGPFATAGDTPRVVFINDPVAGANYALDARTHTARKGVMYAYSFRTGGGRPEPPPPMGPPEG